MVSISTAINLKRGRQGFERDRVVLMHGLLGPRVTFNWHSMGGKREGAESDIFVDGPHREQITKCLLPFLIVPKKGTIEKRHFDK